MKHIDRLVIKARELSNRHAERLIAAFIRYDESKGMYIADGRLWNGVIGGGCTIAACECTTEEAAFIALDELAEKHPNNKPIPIIYGEYDLED